VTAPTGGFVVVVASWYFAGDTDDTGRCYLNTTPNTEEGPSTFSRGEGSGSLRDSAAMTRTFQVSGGDTSFHLNCTDGGTDMHVVNPLMSALFVPNRY
jgi:hypothetical protein